LGSSAEPNPIVSKSWVRMLEAGIPIWTAGHTNLAAHQCSRACVRACVRACLPRAESSSCAKDAQDHLLSRPFRASTSLQSPAKPPDMRVHVWPCCHMFSATSLSRLQDTVRKSLTASAKRRCCVSSFCASSSRSRSFSLARLSLFCSINARRSSSANSASSLMRNKSDGSTEWTRRARYLVYRLSCLWRR
jgi:hypothetical protein